MDTQELIQKLKQSNLYAECPCGGEFKLSDTILFDGTNPFPAEALKTQKQLKQKLESRKKDLEKRKKLTTEKTVITTKSVNIGKTLEKVISL